MNSIFFELTNEEEVNSTMKQVKTKKALWPNSIPTKIIKTIRQIITKPLALAYLSNLSFPTGVFLDLLNMSNVMPIFRRGTGQPRL